MPTYTFANKNTDEVFDKTFSSYKDKDAWLEENTDIRQVPSTVSFVSNTKSTLSQTSSDWRNHLENIKKTSGRGNTINT